MFTGSLLQRLIDFFVGLVLVVLGLRVLFRLFGANAGAGFVDWIYETSDVLLAPFRGIFPVAELDPGNVLDFSALFAMLMYAILGYLLSWLVGWVPVRDRTTVVTRKR